MKSVYKRVLLAVCVLAGLAVARFAANAEHFDILLRVKSGNDQAEAYMDTSPPEGGVNRRPVVKAKVGEMIRVTWRMKSAYPHGVMKSVTIRFFVVREQQAGQKSVPKMTDTEGVVDNSLVMDFAPDAEATGALRFRVTEPGNYLVRVQSENTTPDHDHEHFSAIDLQVQ